MKIDLFNQNFSKLKRQSCNIQTNLSCFSKDIRRKKKCMNNKSKKNLDKYKGRET